MEENVPGWAESPEIRHLLATADPALGAEKAANGDLAPMEGPKPFQEAKKQGLVLPPYLPDDPSVWPKQTPPPRANAPAAAGGSRPPARGARPAAPKQVRKGRVDGEEVEILGEDGGDYQVRFPDGDVEFIPKAEVEEV